jgi:hypothetical protein
MKAPIIIEETAGIGRRNEPVTVGIPFPRGALTSADQLVLRDPAAGPLPLQTQTLATWPDGSLKWVLLDFQACAGSGETRELELSIGESCAAPASSIVRIEERDGEVRVDNGSAEFHVDSVRFRPFSRVLVNGEDILASDGSSVVLTCDQGREYEVRVQTVAAETVGQLRSTLRLEGEFVLPGREPLARFTARLSFHAGSAVVKLDFTVWNPRAAHHPGGLWDLGDPGSIYFEDLSLWLHTATGPTPRILWSSERAGELKEAAGDLVIYQDSSGGENWRSSNHVNRFGEVKTSFRGYVVRSGEAEIEWGHRPEPQLGLSNGSKNVWAVVPHFWQNFPKALEARGGDLVVRLFPTQFADVFELQGGERKTHGAYLAFGASGPGDGLGWAHAPLTARSTPEWYAATGAVPYLAPEKDDPNRDILDLMRTAIEGDNTFFHRREIIDEYGWRNFGELYADHEAVKHQGPTPLVSHYNNQYDGIHGLLLRYLSSGDVRWQVLAGDLCRHVVDIDIYHSCADRPEFNDGLFWHTDHYVDAKTCTHRCFSRGNAPAGNPKRYGGGPALSHNYSSGFLLHHFLTGSPASKEAVLAMAAQVQTGLVLHRSALGRAWRAASRYRDRLRDHEKGFVRLHKIYDLDGPSRVSGNALHTLLNAYLATSETCYLRDAEWVIRSCVSPGDLPEQKDLLDVENRWFYVIFLQGLGRYLHTKAAAGDLDWMWEYGREGLRRYAVWMVKHESAYHDHPERLEYPTETWAAQDFRKCGVLIEAVEYSGVSRISGAGEQIEALGATAWRHLSGFGTKGLTRPLVLLMTNSGTLGYWRRRGVQWQGPASSTFLHNSGSGTQRLRAAVHKVSDLLASVSPRGNLLFLRSKLVTTNQTGSMRAEERQSPKGWRAT